MSAEIPIAADGGGEVELHPSLAARADVHRERRIVVGFIAFWLAWAAALGWLRASHPGIDHGDPTTDSNILNAGESWDRAAATPSSGAPGQWTLRASFGVPAVDTYRAEGKTPDWYTTYPPGAYWFHQAIKSVGAKGRPGAIRAVSVGVSALAVLVLFGLIRRVCGSALPAALACGFYMLSRPLLEYGDNLHYISLSQLTLFAALYSWTRYESSDSPVVGGAWLGVGAVAFFLDSWLTFEHAMFVVFFAAARCLWTRGGAARVQPFPGRLVAVGLLAAAPVVVLGVRLFMNRAVLGSFSAALAVLRAKAEQRVGSASTGTGLSALLDVWQSRLSWPGSPKSGPVDGGAAEFAMPVLSWAVGAPLLGLAVIVIATWHIEALRPVRRGLGLGLLLLGGGLTWFAVMTEHAIVHRFDAMLIAPGVCVLIGSLAAGGFVQRLFQPSDAPVRWVGRLLALAAIGAWVFSLKSSYALNTVVRAESAVREAVSRRAVAAAGFAAAGKSLGDAGITRLRMFERDAPAARSLGLPFDNLPGGLSELLRSDEALLVPLWGAPGRQAAASACATLGLPDIVSPLSAGNYLVFRDARAEADREEHIARSGLRIERLAWRPTLDGTAWALVAFLRGGQAAEGAPAASLDELRAAGVELRIVGFAGEPGAAGGADGQSLLATVRVPATAPSGDGVRDGDSALVWAVLPRERLTGIGVVELRAAWPGRPARWGWQGEPISWKPAPWAPDGHAAPPVER